MEKDQVLDVTIRNATFNDEKELFELFKEVAKQESGIARTVKEISSEYVSGILDSACRGGVVKVAIDLSSGKLVGVIQASKYGIRIFDHILTSLTIAVHPLFQGKGIGKLLFSGFLEEIEYNRKDIARIELESRASNPSAIALYKKVGFVEEGRMKNKTRNENGSYEDSILMAWMNPAFNYK